MPLSTITPTFLATILDLLIPLLLTAGGTDEDARHDAIALLADFAADTAEELSLAAEVISFRMRSLRLVSDSVRARPQSHSAIDLVKVANTLRRNEAAAQRKLDALRKARLSASKQPAGAPPGRRDRPMQSQPVPSVLEAQRPGQAGAALQTQVDGPQAEPEAAGTGASASGGPPADAAAAAGPRRGAIDATAQRDPSDRQAGRSAAAPAPDKLIPGGIIPDGVIPDGVIPGGIIPCGTIPAGTSSDGIISGGIFPGGVTPGDTIRQGTIPEDILPVATFPGGAIPGRTYSAAAALLSGSTVLPPGLSAP